MGLNIKQCVKMAEFRSTRDWGGGGGGEKGGKGEGGKGEGRGGGGGSSCRLVAVLELGRKRNPEVHWRKEKD